MNVLGSRLCDIALTPILVRAENCERTSKEAQGMTRDVSCLDLSKMFHLEIAIDTTVITELGLRFMSDRTQY